MDRWARQLSPAARALWLGWDEPERQGAEQAARSGAVEADPDLALVVGEMQLIESRPYTGRRFAIVLVGLGLAQLVNAVVVSPWSLLGAIVVLVMGLWQARRWRPVFRSGVANLAHAGNAGRHVAHRYREHLAEQA